MYGVNTADTPQDYIDDLANDPLIDGLGNNAGMFMLYNPTTNTHSLVWDLPTGTTLDINEEGDSPTTYSGINYLTLSSGFVEWGSYLTISISNIDPDA